MATVRKTPNGTWQVIIRRKGLPQKSKTFKKKADADRYGRNTEAAIEQGVFVDRSRASIITCSELLAQYVNDVVQYKPCYAVDRYLIKPLIASLGSYTLDTLTPQVLSQYRDERLRTLTGSSVKRELGFIQRAINYAIKDLGIRLAEGNPISLIRMPKENPPREKIPSDTELDMILGTVSPNMIPLIEFAIETCMRRSELLRVKWADVDFDRRVLLIPISKNGRSRRIPLTTKAVCILKGLNESDAGPFQFHPDSVSTAFSRACKRVQVDGIVFHSLRHLGITRLFNRGLSIMEVSSISGHLDVRMLRRYTHIQPEDLLDKVG